LKNTEPTKKRILVAIKNDPEKCMSFEDIYEILNPKKVRVVVAALNELVEAHRLRPFRAIRSGRAQKFYRLI